jgi:glyoxylase-like metal-dependent hydrolase (beta-lactamase superfamily II)
MFDAGAGKSTGRLTDNIQELGFNPENLTNMIITHCHIDHIGSAAELREKYKLRVIAHTADATAIESGKKVGAEFYGVRYRPCKVDVRITEQTEELTIGTTVFNFMHIPGHTPGSIAISIKMCAQKVLFGQDIHGPYQPIWGGDHQLAVRSLGKLLEIRADILCEGHYGVIQPAAEVEQFIHEFRDSLSRR